MKSIVIILSIAILIPLGWFLFASDNSISTNPLPTKPPLPGFSQQPGVSATPDTLTTPDATSITTPTPTTVLISNVPFTAQAPTGNWADPRQQDACEEASVLMAMYWVQGKPLTPMIAEREILAISDYEEKTYGSYRDTSAEDTNTRILKGYFHYNNAEVRHNIDLDDIKAELRSGNVLITPMNGKMLGNPNFTGGGPDRHMLVVVGYDSKTKQIITNDPGTRNGKLYRYNEFVFLSAIRDYETGYHESIIPGKKSMIIVKPN